MTGIGRYDNIKVSKISSCLLLHLCNPHNLMAMAAGAYIGFGNLLINTIGGQLAGAPATKLAMGAAFGIALSLVVIAGSELFTGNNLVMAAGIFQKKITVSEAVKLWIVCWIGNLAGSALLAVLFHFSGLNNEATATFLATAAATKMTVPFVPLLIRGILCNVLVCLAIWCSFRCKSDAGKLIMQLTVALLDPAGQAVSIGGYFYNLVTVTIGNMIGGICFVALPYYVSQAKD